MNEKILKLAVPNIVSNITVPLLGMVDLAIMGHYGGERFIAAMAIGTAVFSLIYWNFGFLRMGTSGLAAQAYGARNLPETMHVLLRGLTTALCIAFMVLVFQSLLFKGAISLMEGSGEARGWASEYFHARVWAAPATLSMYAFTGWFIGMQNSRTPMWISIAVNVINIVCSLWFVAGLKMGIAGVAWGTVAAQYSGLTMAVLIWLAHYKRLLKYLDFGKSLQWNRMRIFFDVNRDIFLRTICLVAVFTFFTAASSRMGDAVLAVNTLLMQLFILFSYIMDGFAYAGEALVGRYTGAVNRQMLAKCVRFLIGWGAGIALVFTLTYSLMLQPILSVFTDETELLALASKYRGWVIAVPLAGFLAFLYDGVLVGATRTRLMRNSMFFSSAVFFAVYYGLNASMGNNALWIAFLTYLFLRGAVQFVFSYPVIFKQVSRPSSI